MEANSRKLFSRNHNWPSIGPSCYVQFCYSYSFCFPFFQLYFKDRIEFEDKIIIPQLLKRRILVLTSIEDSDHRQHFTFLTSAGDTLVKSTMLC